MRALRLLALAAALALTALLVDARGRGPTPEPVLLLPLPSEPPPSEVSPPEVPPPEASRHDVLPGDRPAAASAEATAGAAPEPSPAPGSAPPAAPSGAWTTAAEAPVATESPPAEPPALAPSALVAAPTEPGLAPVPSGTVRDGVLAYQAGDYARAFAVWRPLAEAGNARAQFHLGALYLEGRLGPPDPAEAYFWLARAAAGGQQAARPLRDRVAEALPPERRAELDARLGAP